MQIALLFFAKALRPKDLFFFIIIKSSINPINPNPNIHIRPIIISGPTLLLVSPVISIATIINIPPIVGVSNT